jgi:dihydroorotate dehydrogenase
MRALKRLFAGLFVAVALAKSGFAQKALTWQEVRDKFEVANPTLGAGRIGGAMTPTEVVTAWKAGADFIKVFPCAPIGGDKYIKALHASLPQIPLIAAGGVNQQTAANFILSGATAIGIGTELIPTEAIERRQSDRIRELARRFRKLVKDARDEIAAWERSVVVKKYTGTEK